jgi:anti-sigma regulatory factor (Ser/Thr protein kinase)
MHIDSVARSRQFVRSALGHCPADTVDTAELLTSELATNAILHGRTGFDIVVSEGGRTVHVGVSDLNGRMPVLLSPGESDVHGRGLLIVDRLSERWGTRNDRPGKTVWFDIDMDAGRR